MGARKIVDEGEVVRWFAEGRTYAWMQQEYRRKYDIDTVPSMWGNFRRRKGLDRRLERNDDLIPWAVEKQHRWAYPLMMLRTEARRRAGMEIAGSMRGRLDRWLAQMRRNDTVVHYDPMAGEGFLVVPRRPGIDTDLIRAVERKTSERLSADRSERGSRAHGPRNRSPPPSQESPAEEPAGIAAHSMVGRSSRGLRERGVGIRWLWGCRPGQSEDGHLHDDDPAEAYFGLVHGLGGTRRLSRGDFG